MKIVILMENNTKGPFLCEHGLSIYIETNKHRILIDTGASEQTWINAQKLNIDLSKIDTVILSHGHYDHAGGILSFYKFNSHAKIYMHRKAAREYFSVRDGKFTYIGIDKRILDLDSVIWVDQDLVIDEEISIFTSVKERDKWPTSNLRIRELVNGEYIQDNFEHEQYVRIHCADQTVLVSGCAHNGITNIMHHYYSLYKSYPNLVLSGFHMKKKQPYSLKEKELIQSIARECKKMPCTFYTGHCTGEEAFYLLKEIMQEKLLPMHAGDTIL